MGVGPLRFNLSCAGNCNRLSMTTCRTAAAETHKTTGCPRITATAADTLSKHTITTNPLGFNRATRIVCNCNRARDITVAATGTQRHNAARSTTIATTTADTLTEKTNRISTFCGDTGVGNGGDRYIASLTAGTCSATEGHDSTSSTAVTTGAADTLRKDSMGPVKIGIDRAIIYYADRTTVAANSTAAATADYAPVAAAAARTPAGAQPIYAVRALAVSDNGTGVSDYDRTT